MPYLYAAASCVAVSMSRPTSVPDSAVAWSDIHRVPDSAVAWSDIHRGSLLRQRAGDWSARATPASPPEVSRRTQ